MKRPWRHDNQYILSGFYSGREAVLPTLWTLHNETVNIYTHLFGAVYAAMLGHEALARARDAATALAWAPFIAGSVLVFVFSTAMHCVFAMSADEERVRFWYKMDLAGIVCMIYGMILTTVGLLTASLAFKAAYAVACSLMAGLNLRSIFHAASLHTKWTRVASFAGLFVSGGWLVLRAISTAMHAHFARVVVSQAVGAVLFLTRFPEAAFPGMVDHFGSSHQLFHMLVVYGTGECYKLLGSV